MADASEAKPAIEPTSGRARRAAFKALRVALGLAAGVALAEVAFSIRDQGAFPHLNVYVADAWLGARLRPGAEQRVAFNDNPVTSVRINRDGFRGADLPEPAAGEVLVVGDSQVFGLGVEEAETFSAELSKELSGPSGKRQVLNLGVPTYGPAEYNAVLDSALAKRFASGYEGSLETSPITAVYVVNFANDLFEVSRPNAERHAVWDGWAVRAETAPERVFEFPGRELVFRRSHAVYALRSLFFTEEPTPDRGFRSEGTWEDLLGVAASRPSTKGAGEGDADQDDIGALMRKELDAQLELERVALKSYPDIMKTQAGRDYRRTHGSPEDIVVKTTRRRQSEAGRPEDVTASHLIRGAKVRRQIEAALRRRAEKEIKKQRSKEVLASLAEREAIRKKIEELSAASARALEGLSPLREPLMKVKAICASRGVRLVVVALPLDVMVSGSEWAKYEKEPVDMADVKVLLDDLMATAASLKLPALDATEALAKAEPGAFLNGDIHMTPKGHKALAAALAELIKRLPAP